MRLVVILAALSLSGLVHAQATNNDVAVVDGRDLAGVAPADLRFSGRVFVRDTVSSFPVAGVRVWNHDRSIDSARLNAKYRQGKALRLKLSIEFAGGDASLKDTYARVRPAKGFYIQAGRFRRPISFVDNDSRATLPSQERGLLSDVAPTGNDPEFLGDRGDGVMLSYRLPTSTKLRVSAAAFANDFDANGVGLDASEQVVQDGYLRGELRLAKVWHLATTAAWIGSLSRVGDTSSYRHTPLVSFEFFLRGSKLRLWLEGFVGDSLFEVRQVIGGRFWAMRTLVGRKWRLWTGRHDIEPFIRATLFDPSTNQSGDRNSELAAGVSLWFSERWRIQLDYDHRFSHGDASLVASGSIARLQLAAKFDEHVAIVGDR